MKYISVISLALLTVCSLAAVSDDAEKSIPLSSIVTTSPQAHMRYFNDVLSSTDVGSYARRFSMFTTNASNVFLVDATNERDAISASTSVLFGPFFADTPAPVNEPDPKRGSHWLVAYLGVGPSQPTMFEVENASVEGHKIRLTYHKAKPGGSTADMHRYYFWVPVGKLAPGVYYVELFDSSAKAVTLSRRVEVVPEKKRN